MNVVQITPVPDGPLQVDGTANVVDSDGRSLKAPADQVFLCRCGRSASKPFCDGSHARTGWKEDS